MNLHFFEFENLQKIPQKYVYNFKSGSSKGANKSVAEKVTDFWTDKPEPKILDLELISKTVGE